MTTSSPKADREEGARARVCSGVVPFSAEQSKHSYFKPDLGLDFELQHFSQVYIINDRLSCTRKGLLHSAVSQPIGASGDF